MVDLSLYMAFIMTAVVAIFSPGPAVLMTLMKSMQYTYKGAIWVILGIASGALVMAAISGTGLGILLRVQPDLYNVLRVVGALYLLYLGVKNWRVKGRSIEVSLRQQKRVLYQASAKRLSIRPWGLYTEGFTLQLTNPMLIMFFVSLLPQFVTSSMDVLPQYIVLAITYGIFIIVIHSSYSLVTTAFRRFLQSERVNTLIYRVGGSIFIALAGKVLVDLL